MKKRKKKRIRLKHVFYIFMIVYISVTLINQKKLMNNLESKKLSNQISVDKLEMEIEELNKEIEISDSLEFVEKVAREELGMVKPREIIYIDKNKKRDSFFDIFKRGN